jgi:hypothetical protein
MTVPGPFVLMLACLAVLADAAGGVCDDASPPAAARTVAGWVETGWIGEPAIAVRMKLDTGARTSSINAPRFVEYDKDGTRYVRFSLVLEDGRSVDIDRPVERMATIRRAGTDTQARPVIRLKLCVAGFAGEADFTLADRADMTYPVLVGRAFLAGRLVVDPGRTLLAPGFCNR